MASQDTSTLEAMPSLKMESSSTKMRQVDNVTCFAFADSSSSETTATTVTNSLWNTPESGTFKNPYFIRPSEVKPEPSSDLLFSNCNNLNQYTDGISVASNVIKESEEDCRLIAKQADELELQSTNSQISCPNISTKLKSTSPDTMPEVIELDDPSAREMEQTKQPKNNHQVVKSIKNETDIKKVDDTNEVINGRQEDREDSEDDIGDYLDDMEDDDEELLREIEELSKSNKALAEKRRKKQCIRNECTNPAVDNPYWDKEFCSNDCVVGYCKAIFLKWIESAQKQS